MGTSGDAQGATSAESGLELPGDRTDEPPPPFPCDSDTIGLALVGLDGRFLRANSAFCALLQRSERELVSTTWQALAHTDDVAAGEALVARLGMGDHRSCQWEARYVLPSGALLWAMVTVSVVAEQRDGSPCHLMQVLDLPTYRHAAERRHVLATIAECSVDAVIATDLNGTIATWNQGATLILGFSAREVLGTNLSSITPADERARVVALLEQVRRERSFAHAEFALCSRHGPPIDVAAVIAPVCDTFDNVTGLSISARDISEQRWLAETLNQALSALEAALAEARRSQARSRQFLADAAHQLRTPVAGIRACAETLLRGASPADADRILSALVREASRASRLMASLLRMARLDQGEPISPKPCEVVAVCKDEAERMLSLSPNLHVDIDTGPMATRRQCIDSNVLHEILSNLLDNARRHAESTIRIQVDVADPYVEISVADDGPGIPEDAVTRVFERFFSADSKSGSGLGLPIARELARNHGGDVTYENGVFLIRLHTNPTEERETTSLLQ